MPSKDLLEIVRETPYPLDAFLFVQRGLDFTVRQLRSEFYPHPHDEPEDTDELSLLDGVIAAMDDEDENDTSPEDDPSRHISGQELCEGLRDFAIAEYGLLARSVLRRWKIRGCEDFGHIVFAMVDGGMMNKSEEDSIADFHDVFDFGSAFADVLQLGDPTPQSV